jgi:hypothetical protein
MSVSNPKCYCNVESKQLQVKKEGPNHLRFFLKCQSDKCKFWKWCDTIDKYVKNILSVNKPWL